MFLSRFFVRAPWLNSAAGVLIVLLQRTLVVRVLATAESVLATPAGNLLRALVPVAALGAVNSMAGASTTLSFVSATAAPTVGQPFTTGIIIKGTGVSFAQSWTIANTLPPGITPQGAVLSGGRWTINPSGGTLILSGTPTTAGTYSVAISGYQFTNFGAPVTSATATFVVSPAPNSAPVVSRSPNSVTAVTGSSTTLTIAFTGTPVPTYQWFKDGIAIAGATNSTLSLTNISPADAGAYTVTLTNSLGSATSSAGTLTVTQAPVAPRIVTAPVAQNVVAGNTVQFSVSVSGTPTPQLQWLKDGNVIDGAIEATLVLPNAQLTDAGKYSVMVWNSVSTITSEIVQLAVTPAQSVPVFSTAPASQTVATGATVVFTAPAIGAPAPQYQWVLNGQTIPGATSSTLLIPNVTAANAGAYAAIAKNSLGIASSPAAALVVANTADPGRLTNLSVLTDVSAAVPSFTVGTVIAGGGAGATKPLLIRAAGPSLGALGYPGTLADPRIELFAGQQSLAVNDDWAGGASLTNAMTAVGAFGFASANSKDAALFNSGLAPGGYTVRVSGAPGTSGAVIAEIYDATASGAVSATNPRLIDVSVTKQISPGGSLTLGFTIIGSTAKTVLIRAVGPGLAALGIGGFLPDPRVALFDGSSTQIAANDNWGGDTPLRSAMGAAGAFGIADGASNDALLVVTLSAGSYTAVASGIGNTGGLAIVEVYEVP